ncbi:MAG: hypothetical protein CMO80_00210 [Verrucomicrobiales bacterium]|nr:hypothetical protein [Verrucomicrobiales bacterium]|tara:strand:+ start:19624 stop:20631 length:1008 start_codon:yes stop_codon:yes gene_type:complete
MIINLEQFIKSETPFWEELDELLIKFASSERKRTLEDAKRLHYLYERASSDLNKLITFSAERETRAHLENLVARAYSEVHVGRVRQVGFRPLHWFFNTFPCTFRRHIKAFNMIVLVTAVGCLFGWFTVAFDPDAKAILLPFGHGERDASERVRLEEQMGKHEDRLAGHKAQFSSHLMQNNISVSIRAMAFGAAWGIGTILIIFYNGIIMGGIVFDYINSGETEFLLAWLLPHGSIEIPAILLAGQAGLVLGGAIIGWGDRVSLRARLRRIAPDLVTLIAGVSLMLVWAGIIEAFFSQYHEPVLPYSLKIAFGTLELLALIYFLARCGRAADESAT